MHTQAHPMQPLRQSPAWLGACAFPIGLLSRRPQRQHNHSGSPAIQPPQPPEMHSFGQPRTPDTCTRRPAHSNLRGNPPPGARVRVFFESDYLTGAPRRQHSHSGTPQSNHRNPRRRTHLDKSAHHTCTRRGAQSNLRGNPPPRARAGVLNRTT